MALPPLITQILTLIQLISPPLRVLGEIYWLVEFFCSPHFSQASTTSHEATTMTIAAVLVCPCAQ
jgi:hypothetical protein